MAKEESEQTTLIWWDGKQKKLSDFELGIEQPKMANKPNNKDKEFWSQYEISREQLQQDGVIPIDIYKSTSRRGEPFVIRTFDLMYAYTDFPNEKVKIYRPYGNKEEKWFTNCTQNDIGSIEHLPISGNRLIISKSYKDCRVIRNQSLDSVWFQNEGMIPSPTILKSLCKRFDEVIIWFDNDNAGIQAAKLVASHINSLYPRKVKIIYLDSSRLEDNIKDPSDLISKKGKPLPIKGWRKLYKEIDITKPPTEGNYLATIDSSLIIKTLQFINSNRTDIKNVVLEDAQYVMSEEFMINALKTG